MKRVANPPNPYATRFHEWLGPPPEVNVEVYEERAKSILSENDSPDIPFRWSVNPYRGCQHACSYCYARPYHEYLDLGAGTDFETKLVAKSNAAELLDAAMRRKSWQYETVHFSGATNCYQPIEAVWNLTRDCLRVCLKHRNPVGVVTKSYLIRRDVELLAELEGAAGVVVYFSIPYVDAVMSRLVEPHAPPPSRRFDAMRRLSDAGVPVGVFVAPIIPGLNESQIPDILAKAAECGATRAGFVPLRLSGSVEAVFVERLRQTMPDRADRVLNRLRDVRGGSLTDARFGNRMRGEGVYWESIANLFGVAARKHGLSTSRDTSGPPKRKRIPDQMQFGFDSRDD